MSKSNISYLYSDNSPFTQDYLLQRVLKTPGILPILSHPKVTTEDIMTVCEDLTQEWSDYPKGQGWGSSDMTFATQTAIDNIIRITGIPYETTFDPCLIVRPYK